MTRSIPLSRARRATSALALAASAVALPLAGCGSKPSNDNVDPASAVPASAALYAEATVRPEGALKENTDAAARALTGTREPVRSVVHSLEASGALGHYSFARDIEPWLGKRIGVFLTKLPTSGGAASPAPSLSQGLSLEALVAAGGLAHLSSGGAQGAVVLDA
ncbi:MAG: hypothetical protein FWD42_04295, partial [Solirubrobacterales bacterium]|nr:hypothetical protein [Solirubrobacterales bacterium]